MQRSELVERVSANRLTSTPAPKLDAHFSHPATAKPQDMVDNTTGGDRWPVRSIADHQKRRRGKLKLRIRWAGPYDPTWEPHSHLPEDVFLAASFFYVIGAHPSGTIRPNVETNLFHLIASNGDPIGILDSDGSSECLNHRRRRAPENSRQRGDRSDRGMRLSDRTRRVDAAEKTRK